MLKTSFRRLSFYLPFVIIGSVFISGLIISLTGNFTTSNIILDVEKKELETVLKNRSFQLSEYLNSIKEDLRIMRSSPTTAQAAVEFTEAWNKLSNHKDYLQKHYINENPHPTGSKEKLDAADDGSEYSKVHGKFHPWFREFLYTRGYYDVFVFDLEGNLVYSVFKELDYATNLNTGEWKQTDLGNAFRASNNQPAGSVKFFDFQPYKPSYDAPASFISTPIYDTQQKQVGVLVFQMPIDRINNIMKNEIGLGETGDSFIVGQDKLMRSDSRFSEESTILKKEVFGNAVLNALENQSGILTDFSEDANANLVTAYIPFEFEKAKWALIIQKHESEIFEPVAEVNLIFTILLTVATLLIGLAGYYISKGITKPMGQLVGYIKKLENNETDFVIDDKPTKHEIDQIVTAVKSFQIKTVENEKLVSQQENEARDKEEKQQRVEDMVEEFKSKTENIMSRISDFSQKLQLSSTSIEGSIKNVNQLTQDVSQASHSTSSTVQSVASATEEMSSTVEGISRIINSSTENVNSAVSSVGNADTLANTLAEASEEITSILGVIQDITNQITLLSLNATIESARAGEAGKGFAVVASEVKNLAEQTSKAADGISSQITNVQDISKQVIDVLNNVKESVYKIDEFSGEISTNVNQQNSATYEIAENMQMASTNVENINGNIQSIKESSDTAQNVVTEFLEVTDQFSKESEELSSEIKQFISNIQAA